MLVFVRIVFLAVVTFAVGATAANANSLEAFAYSAAAQSTCVTSSPAPGHPPMAYTVPWGAGCPGLDLHTVSGAVGPLSASSTASVTGAVSSFSPPWSASGHSQAIANYGVLGAMAAGTVDGATDGASWRGHEAFGRFTEAFTFHTGSGTDVAHFVFAVDGTLTGNPDPGKVNGNGQVLLTSVYSGGVETIGLRMNYGTQEVSVLLNNAYVTSAPGLTVLSNGLVANGLQVQVDVPFTYGAAFDLTMLLSAVVIPGPSPSASDPASAFSSNFLSTATLTGITVDSGTNFTITSGSGTAYDRNGVHPVPEPTTLALLGIGILALLLRSRGWSDHG